MICYLTTSSQRAIAIQSFEIHFAPLCLSINVITIRCSRTNYLNETVGVFIPEIMIPRVRCPRLFIVIIPNHHRHFTLICIKVCSFDFDTLLTHQLQFIPLILLHQILYIMPRSYSMNTQIKAHPKRRSTKT